MTKGKTDMKNKKVSALRAAAAILLFNAADAEAKKKET